ncbi:hypothetical protein [Rhodoflexus sp.]
MKKTFLMLFMGLTMIVGSSHVAVYNDNKPATAVSADDGAKKEAKTDKKKAKTDKNEKKKSSCCQSSSSCTTKKQS